MGSRLEGNSSAVRKRIEKHKFENEEGEEYESSKFGGFTDYFRRKKTKLQNLDAELRSSSTDHPRIFRGVVAHVNGYTQPSLNDLHNLIVSYGGGFMQYLDGKTTVTHIIASNLTPKKKLEFSRYRIVKPAWVVDSIKAGKLLPWDGYRVVDEGIGQRVLGFENGNVVSQANTQRQGYRDQTDTSWYTEQVKSVADELDQHQAEFSFSSTQIPPDEDIDLGDNKNVGFVRIAGDVRKDAERSPSNRDSRTLKIKEVEHTEQADDFPGNSAPDKAQFTTIPAANALPVVDYKPVSNEMANSGQSPFGVSLCKNQSPQSTENDDPHLNSREAVTTAEEHNALLLADPKVWKSTVVNPGFLKQYYEESRLHHLSTWKADLKSQLQALAAEKSSSQKSREKRPSGSRRYILHVDFDSFFAAVSLKKHPQYVDEPVVVAHGGGSGSEIASCNYPARKFGIKNGMWMKHAQTMCPNLKVLPYDFNAYEEASRNFYVSIIDTGGTVQSVSVDEALVDVTAECIAAGGHKGIGIAEGSIWREQAKADEVALGIREKVKGETGCAVSVGIGGNILLAKVALRRAKPAGQYHIKPEEVLDFIGGITVQELPGVAYSIGGKLEEIGVKYVKDVRKLTKERLMSTLGPKTGEKIWDYSRGIDHVEVGEQVIRKSVSAEVNWGIRFVTQEQADEFVQCLCEELHKRLVNEKVKGRQLTIKIMRRAADAPLDPPKHLGHGKCDTFNKSVVLGVPTNDKEILGREAIAIMRGWGFSPGELRGIGVQVTRLEPLKGSAETPIESSQKRLQFKSSTTPKLLVPVVRDVVDGIEESPKKPQSPTHHLRATLTSEISPSGQRRKPLNTLGTQFILPSQIDPEVLAELPEDIRSKFQFEQAQPISTLTRAGTPDARSHSHSSHLPLNTLPSQSQLDPETLDALPAELRNEILASYQFSPRKPHAQTLLPQSPHKSRINKPLAKKTTTPTNKRNRLLFKGKNSTSTSLTTLTQSNFVAALAHSKTNEADPTSPTATSEIPADFLSALPPEIRAEVLAQARLDRLKKRGGISVQDSRRPHYKKPPTQPPPGQRRLHLPPRPTKPTFTSRKLSSLEELREAASAWFEEFRDEGPYEEDVEALVRYLKRVVGEEGDMAKAVAVVRWLEWVVGEGVDGGDGGKVWEGKAKWEGTVRKVEEGVQEAVEERGLGRVVF